MWMVNWLRVISLVLLASVCNGVGLEDRIKEHEGYNQCAYFDTSGLLHIGYGHLLEEDTLLREGDCLPKETLDALFIADYHQAIEDALSFVYNYEILPDEVQGVLVDMAYNLGKTRLNKFVKLKQSIEEWDFTTAAEAMVDSVWYNQVGDRSKTLVSIMLEEGK